MGPEGLTNADIHWPASKYRMHGEGVDHSGADGSQGKRNLGQEHMEGWSGRRGKRATQGATDFGNLRKHWKGWINVPSNMMMIAGTAVASLYRP